MRKYTKLASISHRVRMNYNYGCSFCSLLFLPLASFGISGGCGYGV
jgi:hypothetical protein